MKFEINSPSGFLENYVFYILMGLQYKLHWLKARMPALNIFIAIVTSGLTYQVRILTLASTVFKNQRFKNIPI